MPTSVTHLSPPRPPLTLPGRQSDHKQVVADRTARRPNSGLGRNRRGPDVGIATTQPRRDTGEIYQGADGTGGDVG